MVSSDVFHLDLWTFSKHKGMYDELLFSLKYKCALLKC